MFAGWVSRHPLDVIEYLQEENRVLKERLGGRRLCFTDIERRLLARKAKAFGCKVLSELETREVQLVACPIRQGITSGQRCTTRRLEI
jgi:hypothetical protein